MRRRRDSMHRIWLVMGILLCFSNVSRAQVMSGKPDLEGIRVLVFTKTAGFRHASIGEGVEMFRRLARAHGFTMVHSEDAAIFRPRELGSFDAVVFLNTTGDILDRRQEQAFEAWLRAGGGWLGVHAASDTEYDWPFYARVVGAYFAGHPPVQTADIVVVDESHPATSHLPLIWHRTDEWYNFRDRPDEVRVLLRLDTDSYRGSSMDPHPVAWCRTIERGRVLYTALGHTEASYREPAFERHILGALAWTVRRTSPAPATTAHP